MSALTDDLARQYERWVYPKPSFDLENLAASQRAATNPRINHLSFWPDRDYPQGLRILVAGCGANQAAALAFQNPNAQVLGIDVSASSLAHEELLKTKHRLANLELAQLPIEAAASLGRDFDLIAATGVLHHLADPQQGGRVLGSMLKPDGVMVVMLYGRHGRVGVDMLRDVFTSLRLRQDETALGIVKDTLAQLPENHPYWLPNFNDTQYDSGIVDLLLNARERNYTVPECVAFAAETGLAFQGWTDNSAYYPDFLFKIGSPIYEAINSLPDDQIWAAMELLRPADLYKHSFIACRPTRPPRHYVMDFVGDAFLDYVPSWAHGWSLAEADGRKTVIRDSAAIPLNGVQVPFAEGVDGLRPMSAILAHIGDPDGHRFGRQFSRVLWRSGMMRFRIPPA